MLQLALATPYQMIIFNKGNTFKEEEGGGEGVTCMPPASSSSDAISLTEEGEGGCVASMPPLSSATPSTSSSSLRGYRISSSSSDAIPLKINYTFEVLDV